MTHPCSLNKVGRSKGILFRGGWCNVVLNELNTKLSWERQENTRRCECESAEDFLLLPVGTGVLGDV